MIEPGTRLGAYEVTGEIGAGGMGEVYRAHDSKLKRDVALKVLPEAFASDPERMARFEREAQVLAALNHPHIAAIYGIEESGATRALVMELVEGPTLAERLSGAEASERAGLKPAPKEAHPLPLKEVLPIARQIAEALEYAHEHGVIHRDLKPANIKLTADDQVKVLDFGLAKAMDTEGSQGSGASVDLSHSPTMTLGGTIQGMILGTAGYMAPEQAAGKTVDKRADIWAFGVVLYEMLSGARLFAGDTVPETLARVLEGQIDLDKVPEGTPSAIRRLLARCLERNPKNRLRDIGEARITIERTIAGVGAGNGIDPLQRDGRGGEGGKGERRSPLRRALPWVLGAIALLAVIAMIAMGLIGWPGIGKQTAKPSTALTAFGVALPRGDLVAGEDTPMVDVSRDGRTIVFEADGPSGRRLFERRIGLVGARPIDGTDGAAQPFLSPDGRWVGFYAGSHIRKVLLSGGPTTELASVNAYRGATWTDSGWVVYTPTYSSPLFKVRDGGGTPEELTKLDPANHERTHRWPSAVAGTPWVLFSVGVSQSPNFYDDSLIDVVNLDTGKRKTIYKGAWMARFAPPHTLLLQRRGSLFALDFDPKTATVHGPERPVLEDVGGEPSSGAGYFAVGAGGILAYVPSEAVSNEKQVTLVKPGGKETALDLPSKNYWYPRFSPDGKRLALDIGSGQGSDDDIWLYGIASGNLARLTFQPPSALPIWSSDGRWVLYGASRKSGAWTIQRKRADGRGSEQELWMGHDVTTPSAWRPGSDAFAVGDVGAGNQIKSFLVLLPGGTAKPLADAPGTQWGVTFSPDGHYFAYTTTETGIEEIFVSTLPEGQGKWQVSVESGEQPVWSRDGRHIYYVKDDSIWDVDVNTKDGFHSSAPRKLLTGPYVLRTAPFRNYDVGPDGRFALIRRRTDNVAPSQLQVLVGWQAKMEKGEKN